MKEKILKYSKFVGKEQLFFDVCFFCFGFLLSFAKVAGFMSCFCLAFAMAFKKRNSFFCFFGSFLGIAMFLAIDSVVYFFMLLIGAFFKFVFKGGGLKNSIFCAISYLLPNFVSIFLFPVSFTTLTLIYFQTILCASITALCTQTSRNFSFSNKNKIYDYLGVFIAFIAILVAFCNINFYFFNFGRLICSFFVLEVVFLFGVNYAAAAGVIATISFALFTKDFAKFGMILTVSGFLAGVFKAVGKFFQFFIFIFTYIFCCLFFGGIFFENLIELFISSLFALLLPKDFLTAFFNINFANNRVDAGVDLKDEISLKLKFASNMLLDLQNTIKECAKVMDPLICKGMESIYDKVSDCVCKDCGLKTFCWITAYEELMRSFSDISNHLRKNGSISPQSFPMFLRQKCCKLSSLAQYINFAYKEQLCVEQNSRRVNEARLIATEQFSSISDFLLEMSGEIKAVKCLDVNNTKKLIEALKKDFLYLDGVFCFLDDDEKILVDLYVNKFLQKQEIDMINEIVNETLGCNMFASSLSRASGFYKISFFENTNLNVEFSVKQISADGGEYCGDSYDYFVDCKGFAHIILSDGMGNGKRAALDSLMTCSTFRKFIESGFGFNAALKLLNLSFAIKSKEESLATIDVCTIDLYSGDAKFLKAGATFSYVFRKGQIIKFCSKSLPIGIIQCVRFDVEKITLLKGDIVLMVSDGATVSETDWIMDELKLLSKKTTDEIVSKILDSAKNKENKKHKDDITVLALKIV